jgi:hypothetical protein
MNSEKTLKRRISEIDDICNNLKKEKNNIKKIIMNNIKIEKALTQQNYSNDRMKRFETLKLSRKTRRIRQKTKLGLPILMVINIPNKKRKVTIKKEPIESNKIDGVIDLTNFDFKHKYDTRLKSQSIRFSYNENVNSKILSYNKNENVNYIKYQNYDLNFNFNKLSI